MKLMAVRLPDDVAAAVEREAEKQERSKSAVVVRALRQVFGVQAEKAVEPENFLENPRKRKLCQHGADPQSCMRPACKQGRN